MSFVSFLLNILVLKVISSCRFLIYDCIMKGVIYVWEIFMLFVNKYVFGKYYDGSNKGLIGM